MVAELYLRAQWLIIGGAVSALEEVLAEAAALKAEARQEKAHFEKEKKELEAGRDKVVEEFFDIASELEKVQIAQLSSWLPRVLADNMRRKLHAFELVPISGLSMGDAGGSGSALSKTSAVSKLTDT